MQIVIDITEGHYKTLQAMSNIGLGYYYNAILNGTPLPKGHGDLIDRDALPIRDISPDAWYSPMIGCLEEDLDEVPVIVPRTGVT